MCCVLTAAVADAAAGVVYFAHVGDTRLYRYRKNVLEKLTRDHSFVGLREDAGQISEHEAMNHPQRNQILREVGSTFHRIDDEDFIEYGKEDLIPGDCLLLCSDGLTDMVTVQQISTILATQAALNAKVNNLIALANEMGGHDNITVVLLKNNRVKQPATGTKVKKPVKAKNETESVVALSLPVEKPVKDVAVEQKNGTQQPELVKKSNKTNNWVKWNLLVVLLLAVSSWFFFSQKDITQPAENKNNPVPQTAELLDDSLHKKPSVISSGQHTAPSGPSVIEQPDTLRLTATKNILDIQHYADSVGKRLLLIPAKEKNNHLTALEINKASAHKGDTMIIKNMHLKGFETGIRVSVPVYIKLENMIFENVKYPVSYQYKPDSNSNNNNHGVQMTNTEIQ
jgi:hypothetical protein